MVEITAYGKRRGQEGLRWCAVLIRREDEKEEQRDAEKRNLNWIQALSWNIERMLARGFPFQSALRYRLHLEIPLM
jgi:hypothetical protein